MVIWRTYLNQRKPCNNKSRIIAIYFINNYQRFEDERKHRETYVTLLGFSSHKSPNLTQWVHERNPQNIYCACSQPPLADCSLTSSTTYHTAVTFKLCILTFWYKRIKFIDVICYVRKVPYIPTNFSILRIMALECLRSIAVVTVSHHK